MPIHDQSYRHYAGGRATPGHSWAVIASAGIRTLIRKRMFLGLLILALGPFIVRAVLMWISSTYPQASVLKPTSEITLNAVDIDFHDATISSGGATQKAKVTPDKEKEMIVLSVEKPLAAGPATINGAWALGIAERKGSIEPGKDADLALFDVKDYREIGYWFAWNRCYQVIVGGSPTL